MKYIKYTILMLIVFVFSVIEVQAKSATCVYQNVSGGIGIKFEIEDGILKEKKLIPPTGVSRITLSLGTVGASIDDFTDEEGNLYCKSEIYWAPAASTTTSMTYKFSFDPTGYNVNDQKMSLNESDSVINNTDPVEPNPDENNNPEEDNPLVRKCTYDNYVIYYYKDGTTKAYFKSGGEITVVIDNSIDLNLYCPDSVYQVSTSHGASGPVLYTTPQAGTSKAEKITEGLSKTEYDNNSGNTQSKTFNDVEDVVLCETPRVLKAFQIVGYILFVAKLVIPLILIILATIDFAKAVTSSDDKADKEVLRKLVNRVIIAVVIFLIPTVLDFGFSLIDGATDTTNKFSKCTSCLFDPYNDCGGAGLGSTSTSGTPSSITGTCVCESGLFDGNKTTVSCASKNLESKSACDTYCSNIYNGTGYASTNSCSK